VPPPPYGQMPAPVIFSGVRPRLERRSRGFVPGSPLRRWDDRLDLAGGLALTLAAPATNSMVLPVPAARPDFAITRTPALAIVAVFLSVGMAQAADLLTFLRMVLTVGAHAEANPLVRGSMAVIGVEGLILVKIGLVAFVVATFAFVYRYHPRVAALVATFGTVAGLVGALSNVIALG
jgi:hypothetical protein